MEKGIIIFSFLLLYFNISGLSTTNILRLTAGNTRPILSSTCCCDVCKTKIPPFYQLPIISYLLCRGKCKYCHTDIPRYGLLLEIAVVLGMFVISFVFSFAFLGVVLSFLYYELARIVIIAVKGKREYGFKKQYVIAVVSMLPHLVICLGAALLYSTI